MEHLELSEAQRLKRLEYVNGKRKTPELPKTNSEEQEQLSKRILDSSLESDDVSFV